MPERNCSYAPDARRGEIQTPLFLYLLRVFSVPVVLVATNKTAPRLSSLSTFATDDGDENDDDDDVKNLETLLLFPPPGPICLDCFEEEEEEDGKEDMQQKHVVVCVVLVNVETLPLMMRVVFSWMI